MNSLLQCIFEAIESYELNGRKGMLEYHIRDCVVSFLLERFYSYVESHDGGWDIEIVDLWLHIIEEK